GALAAPASAAPATATPWDATLPQSGNRPSPLAGLAEATLAHGATTQPTDDAVIEVAPERPSGSQLELAAQLTVPSGGDPAPTTSVHYRSAVPLGDPLMSARLTRKDGDGETTLFAVGGQSLQLGRNGIDRSSNDLTVRVLPGQSHRDRNMRISGNHLRINSTPEGLFAVDLQSANGSSVDGAALGPSAPHPLTRRHDIGLADALKLCARVTLSPAQALTVDDDEVPRRSSVRIDRVDNRPDLVYALVASALPWHELQLIYAGTSLFVIGSPHTSIHVQGVALAADQALTLCDGLTFHAGAAEYTVHKIEAEDMK
ncbi:MAG: FHA domain-containing protein, partial [Planctomycetota bacterium]